MSDKRNVGQMLEDRKKKIEQMSIRSEGKWWQEIGVLHFGQFWGNAQKGGQLEEKKNGPVPPGFQIKKTLLSQKSYQRNTSHKYRYNYLSVKKMVL